MFSFHVYCGRKEREREGMVKSKECCISFFSSLNSASDPKLAATWICNFLVLSFTRQNFKDCPNLFIINIIIIAERNHLSDCSWDLVALAHNFTLQAFPAFLKGLEEAGWVTSRTHLGPDEWRAVWNVRGIEFKKSL